MQVAVALYVSVALLQREDGLLLLCLKPQHLVVEGFVWLTQTILVAKELFYFAPYRALFLTNTALDGFSKLYLYLEGSSS